jgi:hypothetical protein
MLDRVGDEQAVATSLVRYDRGMHFAEHAHPLGEEFLVLTGTFSDALGDYPAGTYVRNPPDSRHAPWSDPGCLLFVKLRQFQATDLARTVVDTCAGVDRAGSEPRREILHQYGDERVWIIEGKAAQTVQLGWHELVREILSLHGEQRVGDFELRENAWLRLPPGVIWRLEFVTDGRVYAKTRPLTAA